LPVTRNTFDTLPYRGDNGVVAEAMTCALPVRFANIKPLT